MDIQSEKLDIGAKKVDIQNALEKNYPMLTKRMCSYAADLYCAFGEQITFGRSMAEEVTGLKSSRASWLLKELLECNAIEKVRGKGKGKYCFNYLRKVEKTNNQINRKLADNIESNL